MAKKATENIDDYGVDMSEERIHDLRWKEIPPLVRYVSAEYLHKQYLEQEYNRKIKKFQEQQQEEMKEKMGNCDFQDFSSRDFVDNPDS